mmetsp:Transcript_57650/g.125214  ORF Transcript_57650/g.125214 Transcript_57650/m.125214 type:complete len:86 (-) Transcript_57650:742-999(-)
MPSLLSTLGVLEPVAAAEVGAVGEEAGEEEAAPPLPRGLLQLARQTSKLIPRPQKSIMYPLQQSSSPIPRNSLPFAICLVRARRL